MYFKKPIQSLFDMFRFQTEFINEKISIWTSVPVCIKHMMILIVSAMIYFNVNSAFKIRRLSKLRRAQLAK